MSKTGKPVNRLTSPSPARDYYRTPGLDPGTIGRRNWPRDYRTQGLDPRDYYRTPGLGPGTTGRRDWPRDYRTPELAPGTIGRRDLAQGLYRTQVLDPGTI